MPKRIIGKTFAQVKRDIQQVAKEIVTIAGVEGVKHFKKSFTDQGFTDAGLQKWPGRKRNTDPGRAILVKTGRLRRGVRVLSKTDKTVKVGVDLNEVPYAQYHNDGGNFAVKAHRRRNSRYDVFNASTRRKSASGLNIVAGHTRKVPKRQFVGDSKQLTDKIEKQVARRMKTLLTNNK